MFLRCARGFGRVNHCEGTGYDEISKIDTAFCCGCGEHFPVGEAGEFVWLDAMAEYRRLGERAIGAKVGT